MKRRVFPVFLLVAALAASCTIQSTPPTAETTPEIVSEATPEITPGTNPAWVTVTRPDAAFPGWEFQHPEGWEIVDFDGRNIFLYSHAGVGERLSSAGLEPGRMAFQISMNPAANPEETPENHLNVLTGTMRGYVFGETAAYSAAGLGGVQQTGVNEGTGVQVLATSRMFLPGQFIDIFAYSRTDEIAANLPVIGTVIETVRYALPTE